MRLLKGFVIAAVLLVLLDAGVVHAATQSISGSFVLGNSDFQCDRCSVTLLASGVRPVAMVYTDLGGHFTFNNVPPGNYVIHAEIEGFEDVNQAVDAYDTSFESRVFVTLTRKRPALSSGENVVNISEFRELYPKKAVSLFEKGGDSLKSKKNDDAIKYLRQAVELAPTFYEAHNQLGIAYRETGRRDDAEREFLLAHQLNQGGVDPLLNLTTLYLDENDPARAVKTGEEAVKTNSRSAPAFFSLGIALYKAAMLDRAESALKRALELAPKMANVRLMLANVYVKLHRYDNTLDQLNSYIAENPRGEQLAAAQHMRDQLLQAKQQAERP